MRLGFFLDQRKNKDRERVYASGGGRRGESAHRTTEGLYGVSDGPDRWKAEHVRGSLPLRVLIGSIDTQMGHSATGPIRHD
jgi:hypothetical protein